MAVSKPGNGDVPLQLWAWATIRTTETEQQYRMSLAKTNKKRVAFTKLCDVSATTLADTIRAYIEKEELVEEVLYCVDLCQSPNMSCESLGRIVELLSGFQIQVMDLSWNSQLGDNTVAAIQPLLGSKKVHLTDLKIPGCGLTVAGLKCLVKAASKSRLRLLDISFTKISHERELIEQMLELPMIEDLGLCSCDLSLEDVVAIAEALPFTGVKSLRLAGNTFGSQGVVHLANNLSESMVVELDLSRVGLEAKCEGLSQLANAWVKRPFSKLYLRSNPMGSTELMNFINSLQTLTPGGTVDATMMGNAGPKCC